MHKSWVCMTIISTNIMQSLSHTHIITRLIQAPLLIGIKHVQNLLQHILKCHTQNYWNVMKFFILHSMYSCPHQYLNSCLSFI